MGEWAELLKESLSVGVIIAEAIVIIVLFNKLMSQSESYLRVMVDDAAANTQLAKALEALTQKLEKLLEKGARR